jgi:hypothetical protein
MLNNFSGVLVVGDDELDVDGGRAYFATYRCLAPPTPFYELNKCAFCLDDLGQYIVCCHPRPKIDSPHLEHQKYVADDANLNVRFLTELFAKADWQNAEPSGGRGALLSHLRRELLGLPGKPTGRFAEAAVPPQGTRRSLPR